MSEYARWKNWSRSEFGNYTRFDSAYFDAEVCRAIDTRKLKDLVVLEIGFGNGTFLGWARDQGARCFGIEVDAELSGRAMAAGFETLDELDPEKATDGTQKFDLIAAFDVLEHVPADALPQFLISVGRRLSSGGRFIARFPNGGSPFGLAYQHGDLTHRTALAPESVRQVVSQTPMRIQFIGAPAFPIWRGSVPSAIKRLGIWAIRKGVGKFVSTVYFEDANVPLEPNLVVVFSAR
jgi:SAM-dependent methyltransferase